ncbi:citrate synthase [Mycobacterium tuberculosis]|uniref:Citrate synthase n=1 Tax=Mycobacterium tuberculosis TaxID=1773 RepID=A0A654TDR7_MYCTX|nr:citrate synthase [Mycobacterium tuberculosis]
MLDEVERAGDARSVVKGILDRGEKLMVRIGRSRPMSNSGPQWSWTLPGYRPT